MGSEISKVVFGKSKEWKNVEKEVNCELEKQRQHYRPKTLHELSELTSFSKKEIQILYRSFKENCPSGFVTRERFQEIFSDFFYFGDANDYAYLVFRTFDEDGNGEISFEEFVQGLSDLWKGNVEQKLKWIFELYDFDHTGFITERNFYRVIGSIYDMMGKHTIPPTTEQSIARHAHAVFSKMDFNRDGRLNQSEFVKYCAQDANICKNLDIFQSLLESQLHSAFAHEKYYKGMKISTC